MTRIDLLEDVRSVSDFRAESGACLKRVRESGHPMVLTQNGRSAAVLLGVAHYQAMVNELEILRSVHRAREQVVAGRVVPHDEVKARLDRILPEEDGPAPDRLVPGGGGAPG